MIKHIITGGEGFIGSRIVGVMGGESFDIKSGKDILDISKLREVTSGTEGIFHCAAKISVPESIIKREEYHRTNVEGTKTVIHVAEEFSVKIVFSSSSAVYGESDFAVKEDFALNPKSPYAENKVEAENALKVCGVPNVILRYFNVYGPGQSDAYAGVITILIKKALVGEDLVIFGDGSQTRDFVFVDDVVRANIMAMEKKFETNEIFNIAGGKSVTILELVEKIIELTRSSSKISFQSARAGDILHSRADINRAKEILGWEPKVSLEEGLRITIDSFK